MSAFKRKKKKAVRRVRPEKTGERVIATGGERRKHLAPSLTLMLFALGAVFAEQIFSLSLYGVPLAPVRLAGCLLLVCLGVFIIGWHLLAFERYMFERFSSLFSYTALCLSFFVIARVLVILHAPRFLTPVSILAILLVVLYSQRLAFVAAMGVAFLISVNPQPPPGGAAFDFQLFVVYAAGAAVGVFASRRVDTRTRLIKVGFFVGLGHAVGLIVSHLILSELVGRSWRVLNWGIGDISTDLLWCVISGIGAGFVLSGALPFVERIFKLTTDMRLKELSDLNQPILRRFLLEAPGSYHHSLIVGTLAEAAAQRIGANPLLARVGAYFHDIGKLNKPEYFTENEAIKGAKHATLSPTMSTLIIIAHVKDGVEIAKNLNFPTEVVSIVRDHHGTSLVEYFYREALEELTPGDGNQVEVELFRYPGPKPSSKEAAIVLLADAVEAVSRTLEEPSPARIQEVVNQIVRRRLNDGQLDESGLTLTDIKRIEEMFTRVLMGIFHTRIKYQKEQTTR